MEWIIVILGISACAFGIGYYIGYKHCFEYLRAELNKAMEEKDDAKIINDN